MAAKKTRQETFSSDLHDAEDVKDVVEGEDAVVDRHQTAQPRGGGHQQQHEGVSNGAAVETHDEPAMHSMTSYHVAADL